MSLRFDGALEFYNEAMQLYEVLENEVTLSIHALIEAKDALVETNNPEFAKLAAKIIREV